MLLLPFAFDFLISFFGFTSFFKGYVPLKGYKNPYLFQYAYGMVQWLPEYIKMEPQIVIIGEQVEAIAVIGATLND